MDEAEVVQCPFNFWYQIYEVLNWAIWPHEKSVHFLSKLIFFRILFESVSFQYGQVIYNINFGKIWGIFVLISFKYPLQIDIRQSAQSLTLKMRTSALCCFQNQGPQVLMGVKCRNQLKKLWKIKHQGPS